MLIREALLAHNAEINHLPLHRQVIPWASRTMSPCRAPAGQLGDATLGDGQVSGAVDRAREVAGERGRHCDRGRRGDCKAHARRRRVPCERRAIRGDEHGSRRDERGNGAQVAAKHVQQISSEVDEPAGAPVDRGGRRVVVAGTPATQNSADEDHQGERRAPRVQPAVTRSTT